MWESFWDELYQEHEWGKYPPLSLVRFVARNFYRKNRPEVRILEVGCGPGANIWYIAREKFSAYGIDGSAVAIDRARQRLERNGLTADLRSGDVSSLPYDG